MKCLSFLSENAPAMAQFRMPDSSTVRFSVKSGFRLSGSMVTGKGKMLSRRQTPSLRSRKGGRTLAAMISFAVGLAENGVRCLGLKCMTSSPVNCLRSPSATRSKSPISDVIFTNFPNVAIRSWEVPNNSSGRLLTLVSPNNRMRMRNTTPLPLAPLPSNKKNFWSLVS